jgi:hypothetical protein
MTPVIRKSHFEFRNEDRWSKNNVRDRRLHTHTGMTPAGGLQNKLSWVGLHPLDSMKMTSPSWPW